MNEKANEDLSLRFILPVTVENLILVLSGFIFASVISTVSESALSAIGMADSVLAVVLSFFAILSVGSSVITARFIGANDRKGRFSRLFREISRPCAVLEIGVGERDFHDDCAGANERRVDLDGDRRDEIGVVADAGRDAKGATVEGKTRLMDSRPRVEIAPDV